MQFIQRLRMDGLLSFPPDMDFFELQPLNVLIGPNASGKTNFIEVLELLRATPTDFAAAIRDGGGVAEWVWKGGYRPPIIEVETGPGPLPDQLLKYRVWNTRFARQILKIRNYIRPQTKRNLLLKMLCIGIPNRLRKIVFSSHHMNLSYCRCSFLLAINFILPPNATSPHQ